MKFQVTFMFVSITTFQIHLSQQRTAQLLWLYLRTIGNFCRFIRRLFSTLRNSYFFVSINPKLYVTNFSIYLKLHLQILICILRLKAKEGGGAEDKMVGWNHQPTDSGRQGKTGIPGMLQSMGLQRIKRNLVNNNKLYFPLSRCYFGGHWVILLVFSESWY